MNPETFFAPEGLIAKVKPDFQPRAGQQEFSELILRAMAEHVPVIAELPTGSGKSYACLVPAIIAATEQGKRTVISTETIALQSQYIDKDLKLLQAACAGNQIHFRYAVAKGRGQYLCRSRLDEDTFEGSTELMRWAREQRPGRDSGDVASVPFKFQQQDWDKVCGNDECSRQACPFYGSGRRTDGTTDCFIYGAQQDYLRADIVVANHTLVLIDLMQGAGAILGTYETLIVDEAHSYPFKAQDAWGTSIRPRTVSKVMSLMNRMLERVGVNYFAPGFQEQFRGAEDRIFAPFHPVLGKNLALKQIDPEIVAQSKDAATFLTAALQQVNHELNDHICQSEEDPQTVVIRAVKERISKLTGDLHNIYGDNINEEFRDNWLVFLETGYTSRREPYGILNLKPIDVAPLMRQLLFNSVPSSVFMSATMRIGTSFGYMRREMGMPDTALEFIGESPFDFKNNVVGYFPKDLPDNQDPDYLDALAERIEEVLRFSKGRALVLFTNNKAMQHVHAYCSLRLPYLCLLQGEMSKPMLVDYFQKDTHSCLFATKTYFTGLDIPGESLSCVVLTKAPFEVPTEPMFRAKADRIEESGGDSFNLLAMPRMLFDVRQGFGRLIRTTTDTGIFAFLDSRAMKKSYGSRIVNSLPGIRVMKNLGEEPKPRVAVPTSGASSGYMDEEEDED